MTSVLRRERRETFEDLNQRPTQEGSDVKTEAEWSDAFTGKKHQGLRQSRRREAQRGLSPAAAAAAAKSLQSCPTLCDPMNGSTPGLPVPHQLPEYTQTHVH